MGKTREFSSIAGTERSGRGEKWKLRARGLGALALSVAVAFGLYHGARKPAMNDEQMRDMTDNVRTVVLNKAEKLEKMALGRAILIQLATADHFVLMQLLGCQLAIHQWLVPVKLGIIIEMRE